MKSHIVTVVSLMMLVSTAACGPAPATAPNTPPAPPDTVDVVCSPAGTQVSSTQVAAQRDGVHIRVQNSSGASGVYLNYRHGRLAGSGGGEPVDSGTVLVLGIAPGQVHLNCAYDQSAVQDSPVAVEVLDPDRAWRTGVLAALGCSAPEKSLVQWTIRPGSGMNTDAALADLATRIDEPVTWRHVQEGYVDAASQSYVLTRAGKLWATASVVRSASGSFGALLGSLCSAGKASSTSP